MLFPLPHKISVSESFEASKIVRATKFKEVLNLKNYKFIRVQIYFTFV